LNVSGLVACGRILSKAPDAEGHNCRRQFDRDDGVAVFELDGLAPELHGHHDLPD
jgi:hypothetical protein